MGGLKGVDEVAWYSWEKGVVIVEDMCGVWGASWEDYDVAVNK